MKSSYLHFCTYQVVKEAPFYDLNIQGSSSSDVSVGDFSTSCLCRGVVSCSDWDSWVRTGEWVSTAEFRGKQHSLKLNLPCREGTEDGTVLRGKTSWQNKGPVAPKNRESPKWWCVLYSLYLPLLSSVNHHFFTALLNYETLFLVF